MSARKLGHISSYPSCWLRRPLSISGYTRGLASQRPAMIKGLMKARTRTTVVANSVALTALLI
jgi:hypothetical protein